MGERINIVFSQNGLTYHFAEIATTNDGSLEISFPDMNEGRGISQDITLSSDGNTVEPFLVCTTSTPVFNEKKHYISYHTSGRVNYHKMSFPSAFMEPLYAVKTNNLFFIYSFVFLEKAFTSPASKERNNSFVVDISEMTGKRVNVVFSVCPHNFPPSHVNCFKIDYPLYSLHIEVLEDNSSFQFSKLYREDDCVKIRPHLDKSDRQMATKEQAFLSYNHALYKTNEAIVLPPNGEGVLKIIFTVEMRIPPWLFIKFDNPNFFAEVITKKTTYLTFKVKDRKRNQFIKNKDDIVIRELVLDAEIYGDDNIAPPGCV